MIEYFKNLLYRGELLDTILIGLFGILILKIITRLYLLVKNLIYSFKEFTISGTWIATFDSILVNGEHIIELVQLKQNKEDLSLYVEHYNNQQKKVTKYIGRGIKRGEKFSAFYNSVNKSRDQSGVLALVSKSNHGKTFPIFTGTCIEYWHSTEDKIKEFKTAYELRRIQLSLYNRVRLFLKITCFQSYDKIYSCINK